MRVIFGFNIVPLDGGDTGLQVAFQAGPQAGDDGQRTGMEIVIAPIGVPVGTPFNGWTIAEGLAKLGDLLKIDALAQIGQLSPPEPWDRLFNQVQVAPSLRLRPVGSNPSVMLEAQLFESDKPHDQGVTIGGDIAPGISVEPKITVYALVAGYSSSGGLDLKARVLFHPTDEAAPRRLTHQLGDVPKPEGKPQLVSYPFPLPDQNTAASFKLNFLGLGQRFAPTIDLNAPDPLAAAFDALESTFTSDDPTTIINTLVQDYYKPEVGWFFALHLEVRGFTVRVVLADPVLYGLEVTCESGPLQGLLAEILYQKIGSDLGVFYGKIVLPDNIRQINVGAGSATIPSFQLWIYTNGDFKVAIGWPLGPDSFSLQVYIFMGEAGLYFGRLRSGDNPTGRVAPQVEYNPILVFGLALRIGIGRSFSKGPISAEASLTLQGVFQGLLAWKSAGAQGESGIAHNPDYYWFSASVTLAGVVQGSVDLGIISASVCIEVWATIAAAFETDCNTVVFASVGVDVSVSIKIVFFTIHIHFSATLDLSFTLIHGHATDAALDGPSNPYLRAFIPNEAIVERPQLALRHLAKVAADDATTIKLSFMLQPAVHYDASGAGSTAAVATLMIASPDPANPDPGTDFETLADLMAPWSLATWGGPAVPSWAAVVKALGPSGQPGPIGFESGLTALLSGVTFEIAGVDLTKSPAGGSVAIFPMLDSLAMSVGGSSWTFGDTPLTYSGYPNALAAYFTALSALTPKPPPTARVAAADGPDGPSLSHLLYINWFLSMARQIASAMADAEKINGGTLPTGSLPPTKTMTSIAGMLSRMALHGARLPDPALVHGPKDPITEAIIHPLYSLDHQQFAGAGSADLTATLSLGATGSLNIRFATGEDAVAVLQGGAAPPEPNPGWGSGTAAASGIAVSPIDPLVKGELTFSVTARTQGSGTLLPGPGAQPLAQILTLPPAALPYLAAGGLAGALRTSAKADAPTLPFASGLLVPLSLRRVPITTASDLRPSESGAGTPPSVVPAWCHDVYSVIGTDDDTRELLEQALDGGLVRRITPLTLQSGVLTAADLDLANHPVLAFKSNLSTTSQPNALTAPRLAKRLAAGDDLGPASARLDNITDFLRLVWEASVVHTSGFYLRYEDAQGNGLPADLFDKDVARFWLWLDLGAAGDPAAIPACANSLAVADTGPQAKATLYLSLTSQGSSITGWRPAYPPGCVGAQLVWTKPPKGDGTPWSPASVAALYQMVELQIGGGSFETTLWSTALSPVCQTEDGGEVQSATYKQVVPAWRYLATPAASPYAAVGMNAPLNFRLSDIYGNVLADPSRQFTAPIPVVYNDPLLAPSSWPGCQVAYDLGKDKAGAPALSVIVTFDPAGLQAHAAKLKTLENGAALADDAMASARTTWTTIAQQVHDPNFSAVVTSSLYGNASSGGAWPPLGDPAATLSQLRAMVDTLNAVVQGSDPQRTTASLSLPLSLAAIAARPSDIFAFGVRLGFARSGVAPTIAEQLPAVAAIEALLPPHLPPPGEAKAPAPLVIWAQAVEALLTGFDGKDGQIKLAQRPMSAADDAADGPILWAVRLSASAGISVAPGEGQPVFFTMQPFSTNLQYGAVTVTTWDSELDPTTTTSSPASVDPDLLAQGFLGAFDRLMAPDLAAGVARIDGATRKQAFATLTDHKATVAQVLSRRLIPVFMDQTGGDMTEAAVQFEQSLLAVLSNAYATAAVVQVPLAVSVAGTAEAGATLPPRLFGGLGPVGKPKGSQAKTGPATEEPAYTLTSPKLALDGKTAPWLTFLATVKEPEKTVAIKLQPIWTVSSVEHDFEVAEKRFGYLASGWLKFVAPDTTTPALNVPLGEVDIPVPLRRYPRLPELVSQVAASSSDKRGITADDPIEDAIRKALRWPLTITLRKTEQASQDDLWVTSTFNQALDWRPAPTDGPGPMAPLTEALVRFQTGFASVSPLLPLLEGTDPRAGKLIDVLVELVGDVVAALTVKALVRAALAVERLIWVLRYAEMAEGKLIVFGRVDPEDGSTPLLFPAINGTLPDGPPKKADPATAPDDHAWMVVTYSFDKPKYPLRGGVPKELALAISGLDLLVDQTVIGSAHITRNADLGARVNPLLVYQTPELFFSNVLAPFVEVTQMLGPMSAAPVAQMLTSVLEPFTEVGVATGQQRTVRVAIAYKYPLATTVGADPLMATLPVLMNAGAPLDEDPAPLAGTLAEALQAWAQQNPLPRPGAIFSVSVSLFVTVKCDGGVPRPVHLLTLDRIDLKAPAGWPSD